VAPATLYRKVSKERRASSSGGREKRNRAKGSEAEYPLPGEGKKIYIASDLVRVANSRP